MKRRGCHESEVYLYGLCIGTSREQTKERERVKVPKAHHVCFFRGLFCSSNLQPPSPPYSQPPSSWQGLRETTVRRTVCCVHWPDRHRVGSEGGASRRRGCRDWEGGGGGGEACVAKGSGWLVVWWGWAGRWDPRPARSGRGRQPLWAGDWVACEWALSVALADLRLWSCKTGMVRNRVAAAEGGLVGATAPTGAGGLRVSPCFSRRVRVRGRPPVPPRTPRTPRALRAPPAHSCAGPVRLAEPLSLAHRSLPAALPAPPSRPPVAAPTSCGPPRGPAKTAPVPPVGRWRRPARCR